MKIYCFLLVLIFSACQGQQEQKCKYNPEPVFNSAWAKVSDYSFEKKGTKATEKVTFPSGVRLELFQTICNDTQQEYHFYMQGDYRSQPNEFWIAEAANRFFEMASIAKEVEGIAAWGLQIEKEPARYILGEKINIENGISIKIDKLVGTSDAQVIITIGQTAEK